MKILAEGKKDAKIMQVLKVLFDIAPKRKVRALKQT